MTTNEQLTKWYEQNIRTKEAENEILEHGVDIVVIDSVTRRVRAYGIWIDIKSVARIKRLIERENRAWGEGSQAVAVATTWGRSGLNEIITNEEILYGN